MTKNGPQTSIVAFLDVIACGFGAVVLLVLILPVGEFTADFDSDDLNRFTRAQSDLVNQVDVNNEALVEIAGLEVMLQASLGEAQLEMGTEIPPSQIASLERRINVMKSVITSQRGILKDKMMSVATKTDRGLPSHFYGIPVDSDYLALVIDTSGSMQKIRIKVLKTISEILENYPDLKGFQVLSDQGEFLLSNELGWIPADEDSIDDIIRRLRSWNPYSNSSPVEGIEVAVRELYQPNLSLGIFVVGDDYTGTSFDSFLSQINAITSSIGSTGQLRIHALGFHNEQYSQYPDRFGRLMQVLTFNHGGAFMYIGDDNAEPVKISRGRTRPSFEG
ncbi:hypothetical protein N9V47_06930 [Luminiphilus sp.]|nr:hypothetical protein [Luminiphilus sp.]